MLIKTEVKSYLYKKKLYKKTDVSWISIHPALLEY